MSAQGRQIRLGEYPNTQADLSHRWAHIHLVGFVMRRLIYISCCSPFVNLRLCNKVWKFESSPGRATITEYSLGTPRGRTNIQRQILCRPQTKEEQRDHQNLFSWKNQTYIKMSCAEVFTQNRKQYRYCFTWICTVCEDICIGLPGWNG